MTSWCGGQRWLCSRYFLSKYQIFRCIFRAFYFQMIFTHFKCIISISIYQICANEVSKYIRSCRQKCQNFSHNFFWRYNENFKQKKKEKQNEKIGSKTFEIKLFKNARHKKSIVNVTFKILNILTNLQDKNCLIVCFYIYMWSYKLISHHIKIFTSELHGSIKEDEDTKLNGAFPKIKVSLMWVNIAIFRAFVH